LASFEYDTNWKGFLRFVGRGVVNTIIALGIALVGYGIQAVNRSNNNPPGVTEKFFLIYFLPAVIGSFVLFAFAD